MQLTTGVIKHLDERSRWYLQLELIKPTIIIFVEKSNDKKTREKMKQGKKGYVISLVINFLPLGFFFYTRGFSSVFWWIATRSLLMKKQSVYPFLA